MQNSTWIWFFKNVVVMNPIFWNKLTFLKTPICLVGERIVMRNNVQQVLTSLNVKLLGEVEMYNNKMRLIISITTLVGYANYFVHFQICLVRMHHIIVELLSTWTYTHLQICGIVKCRCIEQNINGILGSNKWVARL